MTQSALQAVPPATVVARKPPLPALTGVRTLLAINIVFFHFTPPHMHSLYPVINNAFVFVGFFFLISGYILSYNYADRPTPIVKRDFWRARFARLYPVYLLALVVSFKMLEAEWHVRSHWQFWLGVTLTPLLVQGWNPDIATFWNTVGWTLSSEVMLYAAFPYLIRLPWPKTTSRLIALLLAIWVLGITPHIAYYLLNPDHLTEPANRFTSAPWLRLIKFTPVAYICTFLAGLTLGRIQASLTVTTRQRSLIAAVSLGAIVLFFATTVTRIPYILMHGGLLVPLFGALIIGLSGPGPVASVFAWRPLVLLGQTTYCLYLLHFNFINLLRIYRVPERLHLAAFDPWVSYLAALTLAFAAMHLVERPARKFILRRPPQPAG